MPRLNASNFFLARLKPSGKAKLDHFNERLMKSDSCTILDEMRSKLEEYDFLSREMKRYDAKSRPVSPTFKGVESAFACAHCGKCCEKFVIGITIIEVKHLLTHQHLDILAMIRLADDKPYFRFLSKREYSNSLPLLSPGLKSRLGALNPSLGERGERMGRGCVFHDAMHHHCTIYQQRPLECKIYPIGNALLHHGIILCPPAVKKRLDLSNEDNSDGVCTIDISRNLGILTSLNCKADADSIYFNLIQSSRGDQARLILCKIALLLHHFRLSRG
ncbi:hypothetical protein GF325_18905 [Candidatus Bathyarchaeota archaeon]|nr:hypothetical protein [Candidatus Bathyarchaeota archaeon]